MLTGHSFDLYNVSVYRPAVKHHHNTECEDHAVWTSYNFVTCTTHLSADLLLRPDLVSCKSSVASAGKLPY